MTTTSPPATTPIGRGRVFAWGLWDWGSSSFNAVINTFIFTPYVIAAVVADTRPGGLTGNTWLGISTAVAGLIIALLAPVTGQRADAGGRRKRSLAVWSMLLAAVMLAMFAVRNEPRYFILALVLLGAGAIFQEFAVVSYNAMLSQVSTPATVGRVSGFGWSMGYFGGILLLLICYFGFIAPEVGLFGVTSEGGLEIRAIAVLSAVWFVIFAIPLLVAVPEVPPGPARRRVPFLASYRVLLRDVKALYRTDRNTIWFLVASALYRDGLTAVFTFGAVLAVSVFGLSQAEVLQFGIAANLLGAIAALVLGRIEDRVGPKVIIMVSLAGLIVASLVLLFASGPTMFWIFGLLLTIWVGPAQARSRSFLSQVSPPGREGEMFGLYATTGRAASFIAPALLALFSYLFSDRVGILAIVVVLLAGALALARVTSPPRSAPEHNTPSGS